jgi:hypothetical protein
VLGLPRSTFPGSLVDIGRFGALGRIDSLSRTLNDSVGAGVLARAVVGGVEAVGTSIVRDVAKGLDVNRLLLPAASGVHVLSSAVRPAFEQVHRALSTWSRAFGSFDQIGRYLARIPLLAALRARRAALRGDLAGVREFIVDWLEGRPSEPMVEATIDALLEDDWVPYDDDLVEVEVIEYLRGRTTDRYTRRHKMIGGTQLLGRRIDSLDRPIPLGPSGDLVPLVALTADPVSRPAQDAAPADEQRVRRALAQFKPDEQTVLL